MILVDKEHLVLEYDEALKTFIQTWKGYYTSEAFRAGVNRTNEFFKENRPVRKFLVDISTSSVIKGEDTNWAAHHAIPIAMQYGLKYYGLVLPANVFTQVSLNNFKEELIHPGLEVVIFKTLEDAKDWVSQFE